MPAASKCARTSARRQERALLRRCMRRVVWIDGHDERVVAHYGPRVLPTELLRRPHVMSLRLAPESPGTARTAIFRSGLDDPVGEFGEEECHSPGIADVQVVWGDLLHVRPTCISRRSCGSAQCVVLLLTGLIEEPNVGARDGGAIIREVRWIVECRKRLGTRRGMYQATMSSGSPIVPENGKGTSQPSPSASARARRRAVHSGPHKSLQETPSVGTKASRYTSRRMRSGTWSTAPVTTIPP